MVVHEPHGHCGKAGGKFLQLNAVGLVDLHAGVEGEVHSLAAGALAGEEAFENFLLQQAQLAVGHDQEVAAAAAGVQKAELFEAAVQGIEAGAALAGGDQLPAQLIEK